MRQPEVKTTDQIAQSQRVTLLELLDRLLDKGAVVKGEVLLSVADIDLVYLNLGLLLSSVKTVQKAASIRSSFIPFADSPGWQTEGYEDADRRGEVKLLPVPIPSQEKIVGESRHLSEGQDELSPSFPGPNSLSHSSDLVARTLPSAIADELDQLFAPKASIDPENVEKGLAKLVLTLIDLIRKLMEKQAVRRMEDRQLNADEVERMGTAFLLLDEKMEQLKKTFDLEDEDLNLDLGPLGNLL